MGTLLTTEGKGTHRNRLTYANVTATLALVIAVAGGTADAADAVFSSDIVNREVKSVDMAQPDVSADVVGRPERSGHRPGGLARFAASIGGADHVIAEKACELGGEEGVNEAGITYCSPRKTADLCI